VCKVTFEDFYDVLIFKNCRVEGKKFSYMDDCI